MEKEVKFTKKDLEFIPGSVWTLGMPTITKNVYMDLKGQIRPTPFKMPQDGMYIFDGQFFYHTKSAFKELWRNK